jgi:ATP-dependent 26S proteasome regulatory subunit/ribosomal protein S18 acetylase RimI-like enzyme
MGSEIAVESVELQVRDLDDSRLEQAVRLWEETADPAQAAAFSLAEVLAAVTAREPALVAMAGDEVIGAIATAVDGERAWIVRWSVAPAWRRRGVGATLLQALERRLLSAGVRDVSLLAPRDAEAVEAARALGYRVQEDLLYLDKRRLQRKSVDDRVEELGGQWLPQGLWHEIGGMDREKDLIERRVVLPLSEREEAERHGVAAASAVILFGPPGTGKTTFAKAIAGRLGWPFVEIFPSQLAGSDAHGRAGALRDLFDRLLYLDSVVVFIDEVEEIASNRQERPETVVIANELLKVIPQFRQGDSRLLVVATNAVHDLDHAFTRPGRFDYLLPVGPPDLEARGGIWRRYVQQITDNEVDVRLLADRSQYFSAADIEFAARKAAQAAFERSLALGHEPATTDDFLAAIADVRPSITASMAREFDEDIDRYARF